MKSTFKKILLTLSAVMLFAVVLCFNAGALAETGECGALGDNVTWSFDSETGTLTISGEGEMKSYFSSGNYESPFSGDDNIFSLVIEEGVTHIGDNTFQYCDNIESVIIPSSVSFVGDNAFKGCYGLSKITVLSKSLDISNLPSVIWCYKDSSAHIYAEKNNESFVLIDGTDEESIFKGKIGKFSWEIDKRTGVMEISGNGALPNFGNASPPWNKYINYVTTIKYAEGITGVLTDHSTHSYMQTVIIPDSVKTIGDYAFSYCSRLKNVIIGNGVTTIGRSAFFGCEKLRNITIGSSLNSIEGDAFGVCKNIENVYISDLKKWFEIRYYHGADNPLDSDIGANLYLNGELVKNLSVPDGITTINAFALSGCKSIESLTIPDSVTLIDEYAFYNCINLKNVTIGNNVKEIDFYVFSFCNNIESLTIPSSVEIFGYSYMESLKEVIVYSTKCVPGGLNYTNTIYGYKGSEAEKYADEIAATFVDIETVHTHKNVVIPGVSASCISSGLTDGEKCADGFCSKIIKEQKEIPALGHMETTLKAVKATYTKTGLTAGKKCKVCGKVTVTQKKVAKKKLKKVTISSVKSTKKKLATVTWKKVTDASGYIVEYSTSKKFTSKTTKKVTIKKGKTTKATLKKLKSGKKYYVRVKAYKTVNKKAVYGNYSSVKSVKVK